jgi:hypothetical protein
MNPITSIFTRQFCVTCGKRMVFPNGESFIYKTMPYCSAGCFVRNDTVREVLEEALGILNSG